MFMQIYTIIHINAATVRLIYFFSRLIYTIYIGAHYLLGKVGNAHTWDLHESIVK